MSKIKVNSIEAATGSTITIPSGQTLDISATTLTLPSTVVTTTGTQTLTNKTIGVSQLSGTLPTTIGGTGLTTLGTAAQVLRVNSGATALEFGTAPSGKVLQVVTATDETTRTTSSTSFVTASNTLSVSITPSSASNKVFITMSTNMYCPADTWVGYVTIYRGATNLATNQFIAANGSATYQIEGCAISVLDSPNTTSATTYQVYIRVQSGSPTSIGINQGSSKGTITAFEIAG